VESLLIEDVGQKPLRRAAGDAPARLDRSANCGGQRLQIDQVPSRGSAMGQSLSDGRVPQTPRRAAVGNHRRPARIRQL